MTPPIAYTLGFYFILPFGIALESKKGYTWNRCIFIEANDKALPFSLAFFFML